MEILAIFRRKTGRNTEPLEQIRRDGHQICRAPNENSQFHKSTLANPPKQTASLQTPGIIAYNKESARNIPPKTGQNTELPEQIRHDGLQICRVPNENSRIHKFTLANPPKQIASPWTPNVSKHVDTHTIQHITKKTKQNAVYPTNLRLRNVSSSRKTLDGHGRRWWWWKVVAVVEFPKLKTRDSLN